ncbi:unnamed protein product [Heterosigma akashiwo]
MKAHLSCVAGGGAAPCPQVPDAVRRAFQAATARGRAPARGQMVAAPLVQPPLEAYAMPTEQRNAKAVQYFEKAMISGGLPFHFLHNTFLRKAFKTLEPTIRLPTRATFVSTSIPREVGKATEHQLRLLQEAEPGTMMGDGAKNVKGQKLLNFLIATNKGTLFLFSEDTEGEHITADYMAAKFIRAIELVGPENVAALVTDNAGEMRASFQIIKERFPHLIFLGCAAHLLDKCLRDLLQIDWIQDLVDSSK